MYSRCFRKYYIKTGCYIVQNRTGKSNLNSKLRVVSCVRGWILARSVGGGLYFDCSYFLVMGHFGERAESYWVVVGEGDKKEEGNWVGEGGAEPMKRGCVAGGGLKWI